MGELARFFKNNTAPYGKTLCQSRVQMGTVLNINIPGFKDDFLELNFILLYVLLLLTLIPFPLVLGFSGSEGKGIVSFFDNILTIYF